MKINYEINRLLNFAMQQDLIEKTDRIYCANLLLDVLQTDEFTVQNVDEQLAEASPILENMLTYAIEKKLIEDTAQQRDLFDTRLMNCVMMLPSVIIKKFSALYNKNPQQATDFYYKLSIAANYIRKARIDKNIVWQTKTEYGNLDITINLSKPEKDPRDIAKAKDSKKVTYPQCLLCRENEGFAGRIDHPARQTLRLIPLQLYSGEYFMQYSPYTYYNEHCIVLNEKHIPMHVTRDTFSNILTFVDIFPHYFIGSNADLPIVGGSILAHDHYQGGHYTFAMAKASVEKNYIIKRFPQVKVGRVCWPMSTIRLTAEKKEDLIDLADCILAKWREYSDPSVDILAYSGEIPHNTITPIARRRGDSYELDLVLRNNRTTKEYPLGIFHPHSEVHHIKKENIGLIEVMGLAVLPARLKYELTQVRSALLANKEDISNCEEIAKHADWYKSMRKRYADINANNVTAIIKNEVGQIFLQVLTHAGVYKRDAMGMAAFDRFVQSI